MPVSDLMPENGEKQAEISTEIGNPILAKDKEILDALDRLFDTGRKEIIAEGRRIEFFPGKRKMKDGTTKKTGHYYWEWRWKTDTGRKSKYGGLIETVPKIYQDRARKYQASIGHGGSKSLADALFRPAVIGLRNGDTGTE